MLGSLTPSLSSDLQENRDPLFWDDVQSDPAVHFAFSRSGIRIRLAELAASPLYRVFTGANGGFLFCDMEPTRRFYVLHAAFKQKAWGREPWEVGRRAAKTLFDEGAVALTNLQREGEWRQRPPRSFGWVALSDFEPVRDRDYRAKSWILTREMWYHSTAYGRMTRHV